MTIASTLAFQTGGTGSEGNRQEPGKLVGIRPGRIEIAGSVVDQDGNELEDFVVEVGAVTAGDPFGSLGKRKIEPFGRTFRITRVGVSTIDCIFLKDGYYSERRSFSIPESNEGKLKNDLLKHDVVVVLQKIPEPAPLERYKGYLATNSHGIQSVLYTKVLPLSETPLSAQQLKERSRLDLSRPHVFLKPDTEKGGSFARVSVELEEINGFRAVLARGKILLSAPEPGDGFSVSGATKSIYLGARGLRGMTQAPSAGYEDDLVISANDGAIQRYFYCRMHGQYGKGVVSNLAPIISRDGIESVSVDIEIFLNPTGSRDVSFIHL
jgi:hypothetical protein